MKALHRAIIGVSTPALFLAAACGSPPPAAGYAAPTDSEAIDAYRRTVLAHHLEGSSAAEVSDRLVKEQGGIDGTNYYAVTHAQRREGHNERVQELAKNLETVKASDCVWERFSAGAAKAKIKADTFGAPPEAAYRCKVSVVLDTDKRGLVQAATEGYFFKTESGFAFLGRMAKDYQRLDGKADEPEPKSTGGSMKFS